MKHFFWGKLLKNSLASWLTSDTYRNLRHCKNILDLPALRPNSQIWWSFLMALKALQKAVRVQRSRAAESFSETSPSSWCVRADLRMQSLCIRKAADSPCESGQLVDENHSSKKNWRPVGGNLGRSLVTAFLVKSKAGGVSQPCSCWFELKRRRIYCQTWWTQPRGTRFFIVFANWIDANTNQHWPIEMHISTHRPQV